MSAVSPGPAPRPAQPPVSDSLLAPRHVGVGAEHRGRRLGARTQPQRVGAHRHVERIPGAGVEDLPAQPHRGHRHVDVGLHRRRAVCGDGHVPGAGAADGPQRHAVGDVDLGVGVHAGERAVDGARAPVRRPVAGEPERSVALRRRERDAGNPLAGADVGPQQPRGDVAGELDPVRARPQRGFAFERAARDAPPRGPRARSRLLRSSPQPECAPHQQLAPGERALAPDGVADVDALLDRCLDPRRTIPFERHTGDSDLGAASQGRQASGDAFDDVACHGAAEPGEPGLLERVGVLDGPGGDAIGDSRVDRVGERERASPMIAVFAAINRRRREEGSPWVRTAVFLLGYLVAWSVFSAVAAAMQLRHGLHWRRLRSGPGLGHRLDVLSRVDLYN